MACLISPFLPTIKERCRNIKFELL